MRLLATALLATTMVSSLPAIAQDAGGSSSRQDQDLRYLEIPGQMTPDARATLPASPYASTTTVVTPSGTTITQTGQLPQPMPQPTPLTSR